MNVQPKTGKNLPEISLPREEVLDEEKMDAKFSNPFHVNKVVLVCSSVVTAIAFTLYVENAKQIIKMVGNNVNTKAAKHVGVSMRIWKRLSSNAFKSSTNVEGLCPSFTAVSAAYALLMLERETITNKTITAKVTKPNSKNKNEL